MTTRRDTGAGYHVITTGSTQRLLGGPAFSTGAERLDEHLARLGPVPPNVARELISSLEASGLLGRGGAGFPVGRKWRALAERRDGKAVVLANGAEGEPASHKDRILMATRPHLVLDGAILAADAIDADEIVFYIGMEHVAATTAMRRAIDDRRAELRQIVRLAIAPISYVAGEASAAVNFVNVGDARPTTTPPRVSERGVHGRPTLVQNVESLAYAALIARMGDRWYRAAGRDASRGTALVTVTGVGRADGVREIELGTTVGEIASASGVSSSSIQAVVIGGYFGTWAPARTVWDLPLDPAILKQQDLTFGCGVVGLLSNNVCGVAATAQIVAYMAKESAGQCGPCLYGLKSLGEATTRVAEGQAASHELTDIQRWTRQIPGRGACHHPDGAVQLMTSALNVFGDEFVHHASTGRCSITGGRIAA